MHLVGFIVRILIRY